MTNMADGVVSSGLPSNLFYHNELISSINECVCCSDLNSKLKCVTEEISSLNLIKQFLINDRYSDCEPAVSDIELPTLHNTASDKSEHNVSTCDGWIEVISNLCSKSVNVRNPNGRIQDSALAYQPTPTSNKYAPLTNLQDSIESVNNMSISNELGLLCASKRINQQTEPTSTETNCVHYIPTILNGEVYSTVSNKLVNNVTKRSAKQADKISVYNTPYTVTVPEHTPITHSSKVVILSDSHLKGCTEKINSYLGNTFRLTGWTKPGASAEETVGKPMMDLVELNKQDVVVISAGANDVYMNNSSVALLKITKFIQNNYNTNIIIYGVPHRYDLVEFSCVNRAIQAFNCKLRKVVNLFKHVTILECNHDKELFTNHGMHLNRRGKRLVSKQLACKIFKITAAATITPIILGWKVDHESVVSNNVTSKETEIIMTVLQRNQRMKLINNLPRINMRM